MEQTLIWTFARENDRDAVADDFLSLMKGDRSKAFTRAKARSNLSREWWVPIVLGLAVAGAVSFLNQIGEIRSGSWSPVLSAMVLFGGVTAAFGYLHMFRRSRYGGSPSDFSKQNAMDWAMGLELGATTTADESGVRLKSGPVEISLPWESMDRLVCDTHAILLVGGGQAIFLPARLIQPEGSHERALAQIREWYEASGRGDVTRIVTHLKGHDYACENCGYNLRDCATASCPECGFRINVLAVEAAAKKSQSDTVRGS
jgi:hypothetical protein